MAGTASATVEDLYPRAESAVRLQESYREWTSLNPVKAYLAHHAAHFLMGVTLNSLWKLVNSAEEEGASFTAEEYKLFANIYLLASDMAASRRLHNWPLGWVYRRRARRFGELAELYGGIADTVLRGDREEDITTGSAEEFWKAVEAEAPEER